ncbi:MAG: methyltransferase domain-containing protein [Mariniphaga sp.]|nr:methyltransferase domain-containing protein [Mariniphaga sp.]
MFDEQKWYSEKIIREFFDSESYEGKQVLEIGCAEGGGLKTFSDSGADCYGIEYSASRQKTASQKNTSTNIKIIHGDVLDPDTYNREIPGQFDYIILRDVVEHLDDKILLLQILFRLLKTNGRIFLSFPAKYSAYAGHQQVITKKIGKLPYIYLLPDRLYKYYLQMLDQKPAVIENLLIIKSTRLSVNYCRRIFSQAGFYLLSENYYIIRPGYEMRFGWRRRRNRLAIIPVLREFLTQGTIYVLTK